MPHINGTWGSGHTTDELVNKGNKGQNIKNQRETKNIFPRGVLEFKG